MFERGLRNKHDKKVTLNGLSTILHNPFYIGLIRIEKTGEMFAGKHQPVIPKVLFDRVQTVFDGKNIKKDRAALLFIPSAGKLCKMPKSLYSRKEKGLCLLSLPHAKLYKRNRPGGND